MHPPFLFKCTKNIQSIFKWILVTKTAREVLLPPLYALICNINPFPVFISSVKVRSWPSFSFSEEHTGIKIWVRSDTKSYPHLKLQRQKSKYLSETVTHFSTCSFNKHLLSIYSVSVCMRAIGTRTLYSSSLTTWRGKQKPLSTFQCTRYDRTADSIKFENRSRALTHSAGSGKASRKTCCPKWMMKNEKKLARPRKEEGTCGQRNDRCTHREAENNGCVQATTNDQLPLQQEFCWGTQGEKRARDQIKMAFYTTLEGWILPWMWRRPLNNLNGRSFYGQIYILEKSDRCSEQEVWKGVTLEPLRSWELVDEKAINCTDIWELELSGCGDWLDRAGEGNQTS